ncbi:sensor histidine kinase [Spirosoma radiotolerans]|uniref:Oxygen sensor histidine kinase NreB n=1 Tax=Spirosoma radiotolerans TaxID=1379870 RepID=A0A0E3ZXS0_9BACT|nr:ATP-binding protein [Spirosoma radiotolerans]AKD57094.1 histidine kinase [Spirosoma radiotolerans]
MQALTGEIEIVSIATIFLLFITGAPIAFFMMHQRQYLRYLQDKEQIKNLYQRELLQSQLEIQNQTLQQVGSDLHDNVGQLLTVVVMRLNELEDEIMEPARQEGVQQTRELVRTVISDVRALSKTLDHDTVRRFGLLPSLTLELERIQRTKRILAELTTIGEPYSLGEQTEMVLLRMTQESLNNALKHAQARNLHVLTDFKSDSFALTISDDGRGFSVTEATTRQLEASGAGLSNLYRRAGLLGGTCVIHSTPGAGTRVEIRIPYPQIKQG